MRNSSSPCFRRFAPLVLVAATAISSGCLEGSQGHDSDHFISTIAPVSHHDGGDDLFVIPEHRAVDGRLDVTLELRMATYTLAGAREVELRSYVDPTLEEVGPWGPTLRVGPNDRMDVTLRNWLPPDPDDGDHTNHNIPHDFNTTNLHVHGWHVSPFQDDIFRKVPPSFSSYYSYDLVNHTPGTFWYHPHVHGSTAIQVASGMSGALIVEGGPGTIDHVPQIRAARERLLLFDQVMFDDEGKLPSFKVLKALKGPPLGTTINGGVKPVIRMQPGEVQRWRLVHTGYDSALAFYLEGLEVEQFAVDGINFRQARRVHGVFMGPGNRQDLLVRAPTEATTLRIRVVEYHPELEYFPPSEAELSQAADELEGEQDHVVLATVEVAGPPQSMQLLGSASLPEPTNLPDIRESELDRRDRKAQFWIGRYDDKDPYLFMINGKAFDGSVDQFLVLGEAEEWTLSSKGGMHPYHIHINPFQVWEYAGRAVDPPMWKDVAIVGAGHGASPESDRNIATIRSRYEDYYGDFVLHCHILMHEDEGMMQRIRIVRDASEIPPEQAPHGH